MKILKRIGLTMACIAMVFLIAAALPSNLYPTCLQGGNWNRCGRAQTSTYTPELNDMDSLAHAGWPVVVTGGVSGSEDSAWFYDDVNGTSVFKLIDGQITGVSSVFKDPAGISLLSEGSGGSVFNDGTISVFKDIGTRSVFQSWAAPIAGNSVFLNGQGYPFWYNSTTHDAFSLDIYNLQNTYFPRYDNYGKADSANIASMYDSVVTMTKSITAIQNRITYPTGATSVSLATNATFTFTASQMVVSAVDNAQTATALTCCTNVGLAAKIEKMYLNGKVPPNIYPEDYKGSLTQHVDTCKATAGCILFYVNLN